MWKHLYIYNSKSEPTLVTTETNVTYPVAIRKINIIKCRADLGTGPSRSYISESFTDLLKISPVRKDSKTIEGQINSTTRKRKIDNVKIENLDDNFSFQTEFNKFHRRSHYITMY